MKPAESKLREIMPYLAAAQELPRFTLYRLYNVYAFGQILIAGLATIGVSDPLLGAMKGVGTETATGKQAAAVTTSALGGAVGLLVLVSWLVLWVYLTWSDGQKRALLAKSCANSLRTQSHKVQQAVQEADPIKSLCKVAEDVHQIVDRAIVENAWPWDSEDLFPPHEGFKRRWEAAVAKLVQEHGDKWVGDGDGAERRPKGGPDAPGT